MEPPYVTVCAYTNAINGLCIHTCYTCKGARMLCECEYIECRTARRDNNNNNKNSRSIGSSSTVAKTRSSDCRVAHIHSRFLYTQSQTECVRYILRMFLRLNRKRDVQKTIIRNHE